MSDKEKDRVLGKSPEHPIPANTFSTSYPAEPNTQLVIVNAENVEITTTVGPKRTIIGIQKKPLPQ